MENEQIAQNIKLLCKERKISINNLLSECNLSKSFIYDIEKRKVSPSVDKIIKIADYFNVSVDYILGRKGSFNNLDL